MPLDPAAGMKVVTEVVKVGRNVFGMAESVTVSTHRETIRLRLFGVPVLGWERRRLEVSGTAKAVQRFHGHQDRLRAEQRRAIVDRARRIAARLTSIGAAGDRADGSGVARSRFAVASPRVARNHT